MHVHRGIGRKSLRWKERKKEGCAGPENHNFKSRHRSAPEAEDHKYSKRGKGKLQVYFRIAFKRRGTTAETKRI